MTETARPPVCTKPWTSFEINDHKGTVTPCCWSKLHCGNINDSSFEEIWNGPAYVEMRRHMTEGRLDLICSAWCPYRLGEHVDVAYPPPQSEEFRANRELQREEIREGRTVLRSKPTIINICPSVKCNLDCVMCFQDRDDTAELPDQIEQMIEAHFPTLQELWVIGGEPLVARECLEIIRRMNPERYPDLHLGLITNGTAVSQKAEDLLWSRRLSWILVSVDAATPETFKKIRGGKFDKVLDGIRKLKGLRDQQGGEWSLRIGFTVMKSNMHEAIDFADLADSLGVDCQYTPVFGDNPENFHADPEAVERCKSIMLKLGERLEALGRDRIRIAPVWTRLTAAARSDAPPNDVCAVSFEEWQAHLAGQGIEVGE
jgi:MoaA/NifB/PqqE/SkfB family radical SAM enzyme